MLTLTKYYIYILYVHTFERAFVAIGKMAAVFNHHARNRFASEAAPASGIAARQLQKRSHCLGPGLVLSTRRNP